MDSHRIMGVDEFPAERARSSARLSGSVGSGCPESQRGAGDRRVGRCAQRTAIGSARFAWQGRSDRPYGRGLAAACRCWMARAPEAPVEHDGAGATFSEVTVIAEEMGRAAAPDPYLGVVVLGVGTLAALQPNAAGETGAVAGHRNRRSRYSRGVVRWSTRRR